MKLKDKLETVFKEAFQVKRIEKGLPAHPEIEMLKEWKDSSHLAMHCHFYKASKLTIFLSWPIDNTPVQADITSSNTSPPIKT